LPSLRERLVPDINFPLGGKKALDKPLFHVTIIIEE
jgi:hypothetical protein